MQMRCKYEATIHDTHSSGPICSVKILLTLHTERCTTNFDIGRKLGHYCI